MNLYLVQSNNQSWWVEAGDIAEAIELWRAEAVEPEESEPESVALLTGDPIIRREKRIELPA